MAHTMKVATLGALLAGSALVCAHASPNGNDEKFARLKALAGEWTEAGGDGSVAVTYKVTGGGSAVIETLHPGKTEEMVTVYTIDKGDLVMTHYCMMGNQPRMKAAKGGDPSVIAFKFDGGGNIASSNDGHMHDLEIAFLGADHVKATWHFYAGGKESEVRNFDLSRKKS
jgi:hypothetical protein